MIYNKPYTQDEIDQIRALRAQGLSVGAIAKAVGRSASGVYRMLVDYNDYTPLAKRVTQTLAEMIEARYEANLLTLDAVVAANWREHSIAELCHIADISCRFPRAVNERMIYSSRQRIKSRCAVRNAAIKRRREALA